jgi:uncharacterized protein YecT (DUF1311 family)
MRQAAGLQYFTPEECPMILLVLMAVLSDPAQLVRTMYENDRKGVPDPVYQVRTRASIEQWFDKELADLIWRDLVDAQGEVGRMDGHYLFDAQDDEVKNLEIRTIENKDGRARVLATFDFPMEKGIAEFHLRAADNGWRITDIVYPGRGSYVKYLQADFPLPLVADERTQKELCELYADYKVTVPEGYDDWEEYELAEFYANGADDFPQDFGAAIHFLCKGGIMADAEQWGMLTHVLTMERGGTNDPLEYCAHATSRHAGMVCAGRRDDDEGPALQARYAELRKTLGPSLEPLRARASAFQEADVHWETEQSREGTMYAYIGTHYELDREKAFLDLLELYSNERAPAASQQEMKRADAELNAAYRRAMKYQQEEPEWVENMRAAQREWMPYRDAWIAFYQQRWRGKAPAETLRREIFTAITKARTEDFSWAPE